MLLIDNFYVSIMVDTKRRQCILELRYIIMRDTVPVNAWWRARQDPASLPVDLSILFLARSWKKPVSATTECICFCSTNNQ